MPGCAVLVLAGCAICAAGVVMHLRHLRFPAWSDDGSSSEMLPTAVYEWRWFAKIWSLRRIREDYERQRETAAREVVGFGLVMTMLGALSCAVLG
jgi:hypothetical protein